MKIAIVALTKNGCQTALRLAENLPDNEEICLYLKAEHTAGPGEINAAVKPFGQKLRELIAEIYADYQAFVMIMAAGIVFRTFAPYAEHKAKDPAVVVIDEAGRFAISLLSGHLGGANALAHQAAAALGATPVITTATDVNNMIAFDNVAKANGCAIENIEAVQFISGAMVNGQTVGVAADLPLVAEGDSAYHIYADYAEAAQNALANNVIISSRLLPALGEHTLWLRPKNLLLGIGCRRGVPLERLEQALLDFMKSRGYSMLSLKAMASIDLKSDEEGLLGLSQKYNIPFITYPAEALKEIGNKTGTSDFVAAVTGTPSVSQAAALAAAGAGGKTLVEKTVYPGITLSLAETPQTIIIKQDY